MHPAGHGFNPANFRTGIFHESNSARTILKTNCINSTMLTDNETLNAPEQCYNIYSYFSSLFTEC
jgi:hypothetical protein